MMWLKSCPRCKRGDMTLNEDGERLCLQCGYVRFAATEPGVASEATGLVQVGYADPWRMHNGRTEQEKVVAV